MVFFRRGITKQELEEVIQPKVQIENRYIVTIQFVIHNKQYRKEFFQLSEEAFTSAANRKRIYSEAINSFYKDYPVVIETKNGIQKLNEMHLEKVFVISETTSTVYYPLNYTTKSTKGPRTIVCEFDPFTCKETVLFDKLKDFEEL